MDDKHIITELNKSRFVKRPGKSQHRNLALDDTLYYLQIWEQILNNEGKGISNIHEFVELKKEKGHEKQILNIKSDVANTNSSFSNEESMKGRKLKKKSIRRSLKSITEEHSDTVLRVDEIKPNRNSEKSHEDVQKHNETLDIDGKISKLSRKPKIVDVIYINMGSSISSNSGDRRTNALRRSQRKSITGACAGIDKVLKALKTFKGIEDSEEYNNMKIRIIQIEKNFQQKSKDLQPQFRTIHNITEQKIKTAYEILDQKAKENSEIHKPKGITLNGDGMKPPAPETITEIEESKTDENSNENGAPEMTTAQSPTNENKRHSLLLRLSKLKLPKRESQTSSPDVEVTEVTAEIHKSPEATRKSIMKYGVPVLPTPTTNGVPRLVSFNTPDDFESTLAKHEKRLKIIKQDVANLEIRISEFVGKKGGKHYNNLKDALTQLVGELEDIHEEELLDQVVLCHNYIKSCFSFLDSKVVEADDVDDDVFTNYTDSRIYGSTHDLLEGHAVRTTAI